MLKALRNRELGILEPKDFVNGETRRQFEKLELLRNFRIYPLDSCLSPQVTSLDLSRDNTLLLCADCTGIINIYSTVKLSNRKDFKGLDPDKSRFTSNYEMRRVGCGKMPLRARVPGGGYYQPQRCTLKWHPSDTDLFTACGSNGTVQIWSTGRLASLVDQSTKRWYDRHNMNRNDSTLVAASADKRNFVDILDLRIGLDHAAVSIYCPGKSLPQELVWNPLYSYRLAMRTMSPPARGSSEFSGRGSNIFEFDVRSAGKPVITYQRQDNYTCMQFSGNGQKLYATTLPSLAEFDTSTGCCLRTVGLPNVQVPNAYLHCNFTITENTYPEYAFIPHQDPYWINIIDLQTLIPLHANKKHRYSHFSATCVQVDSDRQIAYAGAYGIYIYGSPLQETETDMEVQPSSSSGLIDTGHFNSV